MRSLTEPTIDDIALYDAIVAAKRGARQATLRAARPLILGAYRDYEDTRPDFYALVSPNVTDAVKDALHHCYSGNTAAFTEARVTLTEPLRAARCPFCGISEASTLDHYLPKELHPVYSVYSRNLVPCCSVCNTRKSQKIFDDQVGVRKFLHPYYDLVPELPFLVVRVQIEVNLFIIKFVIERPPGLLRDTFHQLESHFRQLGLGSRYRANALLQLTEDRRAFARWFDDDRSGARLADELMLKAKDREDDYGVNDWLAVLYRTLAGIPEFTTGGFRVLDAIQ